MRRGSPKNDEKKLSARIRKPPGNNTHMNEKRTPSPRRRRLLGGLGAATLGTVLLPRTRAAETPLPVPPWSQQPGEPGLWHPYGLPSDFEKDVVRRISRPSAMPGATSTLTPLGDLFGAITPNGLV